MLAGSLFGCSRDVAYPEGLSWGEPPLSAYIGQARLGISNNGDDSLSFVSLDTGQPGAAAQLLGTALVGNNPATVSSYFSTCQTTSPGAAVDRTGRMAPAPFRAR